MILPIHSGQLLQFWFGNSLKIMKLSYEFILVTELVYKFCIFIICNHADQRYMKFLYKN
jgi:hypothetical protein